MSNKLSILICLFAIFAYSCIPGDKSSQGDQVLMASEISQNREKIEGDGNIETGYLTKMKLKTSINCNGVIDLPPQNIFTVSSKVPGFVKTITKIPGDPVRKREHLLTIEYIDLISKQNELLEFRHRLELAKSNLQRKSNLIAVDATSQAELDKARTEVNLLESGYRGLHTELELLGVDLKSLIEENKFQSVFYIHSPANGKISEVFTNMGKNVSPDDELIEIMDQSHPHLELTIFNKDVSGIRIGQNVSFQVPGNPERFLAVVEKINPALDEKNTLKIHCHFKQPEYMDRLKVGSHVDAVLETGEIEAYGLPEEAILTEGERKYILIVDGNLFQKTEVQTGIVFNGIVEISGVGDSLVGREVVTRGAYYVQ